MSAADHGGASRSPKRTKSASEVGAEFGLNQADLHETAARPREVVCMESYIEGFQDEGYRAKHVVGEITSRLSAAKVLITCRRDLIYAHSNFVKDGCSYPTKLATNQPRPIEVIAANLVATDDDVHDPLFMSRFWRAMVEDFVYFVDEQVLTSGRFSFLDFRDLRNVSVLKPEGPAVSFSEWERMSDAAAPIQAQHSDVPRNPWIPGLFYLFVLLSVVITLRFVTGPLGALLLPVLIVGGLLAVSVVGAFTLRNQQLLKEKNFLELMIVSLRYLPVLGTFLHRKRVAGATDRAT